MLVNYPKALKKPYNVRLGIIIVKNGSDNRRLTSNDEIARLLKSS